MILDWFNAGEAVLFAQEIVKDINKLFPPTENKGKPIPKKVFQKKFEALFIRTRTFATKNKLNVYKKAKFLNVIKWEMREAGHEDAVIDEVIAIITPLLN